MIFFKSDLREEIDELKVEIGNLRREIHHNTRINIGYDSYLAYANLYAPNKEVILKDVVLKLVENLGLEIKLTSETKSKVTLERKKRVRK